MEGERTHSSQAFHIHKDLAKMTRLLSKISEGFLMEYHRKHEAVFLPWQAEYWNAMESVWKAASEDPKYEVTVIPLPWYYRDEIGEIRADSLHCGEGFPDYVKLTTSSDYSLAQHHPEIIVIQNPYDECNCTTAIDSSFWSSALKDYTENLVYIPWFVTDEIDAERAPNSPAVYNMRYYVTVPGVVRSDIVVVQSERMRRSYVKILTEMSGEKFRKVWENKVKAFGSPLLESKAEGSGYSAVPISPIWEQIKAEIRKRGTRYEVP